ncbi:MAG TPA: radical SAM protein [Nitrososphaeraceae archaeon]|nr:radical SAM protein [Nitrososphaeraceae archaeon]
MTLWYDNSAPAISGKKGKSLLHNFFVYGKEGLTINPYQGCHHRCGYCYATYDWSPEFFNHIYAKINAADLLYEQIRKRKIRVSHPVMISSATDAYQPAELKYSITRQCVQVLQKFEIPYYIFTKSIIIERDLELHKRYSDKCFIVWSITTCNEEVKRIIEPGTPTFDSLFNVIEKFTKSEIQCVVNIDPILPLITDSKSDLEKILDTAVTSGVKFISGAILRLRSDIWERLKSMLDLLKMPDAKKQYEQIYNIQEPIKGKNSFNAENKYSNRILNMLMKESDKRDLKYGFPNLTLESSYSSADNLKMVTLFDFIK